MRAGAGRSNFFEAERARIRRESAAKRALMQCTIAALVLCWLAIVGIGASIPVNAVAGAISSAAAQIRFSVR